MSLKDKLAKHKAVKAKKATPSDKVEKITDLFSNDNVDEIIDEAKKEDRFISKSADLFYPDPHQPRKSFDEENLANLKSDIESIGQLQPILVKPKDENGHYEIIVGERRWRAINSSDKVKNIDAVIVKTEFDELLVLRMQIQENDNREFVNAMESSAAILRGVELCKTQELNVDDIKAYKMLGISRSRISKARALLAAPEKIKSLANEGLINDYNALYDLSVCHKKDSEKTEQFVDNILENRDKVNLRSEVKSLVNEVNESKEKGSGATTPKAGSKKSAKKEDTVKHISFEQKNNKDYMNIVIGKKKITYQLSGNALEDIAKFGKEVEAEEVS